MQFDLDGKDALDEPTTTDEMAIIERLMAVSRVKRKFGLIKEVAERGASRGHGTYGAGNALSATPDETAGTFETEPDPASPDAACVEEALLERGVPRAWDTSGDMQQHAIHHVRRVDISTQEQRALEEDYGRCFGVHAWGEWKEAMKWTPTAALSSVPTVAPTPLLKLLTSSESVSQYPSIPRFLDPWTLSLHHSSLSQSRSSHTRGQTSIHPIRV